jgi:hypothetical protein
MKNIVFALLLVLGLNSGLQAAIETPIVDATNTTKPKVSLGQKIAKKWRNLSTTKKVLFIAGSTVVVVTAAGIAEYKIRGDKSLVKNHIVDPVKKWLAEKPEQELPVYGPEYTEEVAAALFEQANPLQGPALTEEVAAALFEQANPVQGPEYTEEVAAALAAQAAN